MEVSVSVSIYHLHTWQRINTELLQVHRLFVPVHLETGTYTRVRATGSSGDSSDVGMLLLHPLSSVRTTRYDKCIQPAVKFVAKSCATTWVIGTPEREVPQNGPLAAVQPL